MKNALVNLAVSLGTVVFVFLLFEAYLFVRFENEYERLQVRYADDARERCTQADPDLVYAMVPNRCGFNSYGFDDEEWPDKSPNVFRMVLIGDSVAMGQGVSRNQRFGTLLEQRWNSGESPKIEVLNLAVTGYSTAQQLIVLRETAMQLEPDLVWWTYVLNDPAHPVFHDGNGELGRYYYRPTWRGGHYILEKLFDARENHLRKNCSDEFHEVLHCVYRDQVASHLTQVKSIVGDVPVLFTILPVLPEDSVFPDYPHAGIHEDLAAIAGSLEFEVLDLADAFTGYRGGDMALDQGRSWYDPWHPNVLGHALLAEYLLDAIRRKEKLHALIDG